VTPEPVWGRGGKEKNSHRYSCQELNPDRSARSLVSILSA